MRTPFPLAFPALLAAASAWGAEPHCALGTSNMAFASLAEAQRILGAEDGFVRSLSAFDRAARLNSDRPVDTPTFLRALTAQAQSWTRDEEQAANAQVCDLAQRLAVKKWKLALPPSVALVKAAGDAEAGAPHTRGPAIVLPGAAAGKVTAQVLAHELFHVASREWAQSKPARRDALYALVGYSPLNAPVAVPAAFKDRMITNPDSFDMSHGVKVTVGGADTVAIPFLFATSAPYDTRKGQPFFAYLAFRLLAVQKEGPSWVAKKSAGGAPVLLDPMQTNYLSLVGRNTEEFFQADEVLADNFALALGYGSGSGRPLPNPELPVKLAALLASW